MKKLTSKKMKQNNYKLIDRQKFEKKMLHDIKELINTGKSTDQNLAFYSFHLRLSASLLEAHELLSKPLVGAVFITYLLFMVHLTLNLVI